MEAVWWLLASGLAGFALVNLIPAKLRFEDRLGMALPLGLALAGLLTFAGALIGGLTSSLILVVSGLLTVLGVAGLSRASLRKRIRTEATDLRSRARSWRFWLGTAVWLSAASLLTLIFWNALFIQNGTMYAGFGNIWGDWNQHLAQTTSFAYGDNFPPEFSTMSGQHLSYPFLINFISAVLIKGGLSLIVAMKLPVLLLALSGLGLLMTLTRLVAGWAASLLAPPLFLLSGGLGFINFFADWFDSHQSLGHFLANQPHNYTQTFGGPISNINFINTIYAYLVPQRPFVFGLTLVLIITTLLYLAIRERNRWLFLAAGLVGVLLPLVHSFGLVFLAIFTPVWMLLSRRQLTKRRRWHWRDFLPWAYFVSPLVVLALPQLLWLTQGVDSGQYLRFQFGWTKGPDNIFWFWLKNLGLFLPLWLFTLYHFHRRERRLFDLTVAAGAVFVAANLVIFQPWDWDNTKFFAYWLVLTVPAVAAGLVWIFRRGGWQRGAAIVIFISLLLAGSADVAKTVVDRSKTGKFDPTAQAIASAVRNETAPDDVFLTAQNVNNPISGLSGRPIVMGYAGWLWSYGIPYRDRELEVADIYNGKPQAEALMNKYDVRFVVIGPAELGEKSYQVNREFFAKRYLVWKQFGPVTIYDRRAKI